MDKKKLLYEQGYRRRYERRRSPKPKLHWENKKIRSVERRHLSHYKNMWKAACNQLTAINWTLLGLDVSAQLCC